VYAMIILEMIFPANHLIVAKKPVFPTNHMADSRSNVSATKLKHKT